MKVQGEFKMQAHRISSVVVDIAAFKVSHSVDTDATALRAARVRSKSIGVNVQGKFKMQAHIKSGVGMDIAAFKVSHSAGIDYDATALRAARARSSSIHRGNGTLHAWVRFSAKLTLLCHDTPPTVSIQLGRWMKVHGKFKHTLSWMLQPSKFATPSTRTPPPCKPRE
jgi:hypothetical protein